MVLLLLTAASLLFCVVTAAPVGDDVLTATVYLHGLKLDVKYGVLDKENGIVYGSYERSQNVTGWAVLNIAGGYSRGRDYSDEHVMRAAGYLEGVLTQPDGWSKILESFKIACNAASIVRLSTTYSIICKYKLTKPHTLTDPRDIYDTYRSQTELWFSDKNRAVQSATRKFFADQRYWMEHMIATNKSTPWKYTNLLYQQFKGMADGYLSVAPKGQEIDDFGFDFLCGNGDWLDIMEIVSPEKARYSSTKQDQLEGIGNGHCSALIKALPSYENIYASHSTWYVYSSMLRIYKHYSFNMKDNEAAIKTMSFSSYPGILSSWDDFYMMDSKLVMLQTTNSIIDESVYKMSTPHALLSWHRVRLANWLADNGRDWGEYIKEYNSGTYNNQYMILDLKHINLTNSIDDNALWVVEQMPGLVVSGDQTAILREGYWASYNVPFYEEIYTKSGYPRAVSVDGPEQSHDLAPRAKIFRRDQGNVTDMASMEYIMRYNGFMKHDPLAEGSPYKAICSRGDLLPDKTRDGGCTDTKVTDYNMALAMKAYIQSGPTHQDVPVFQWSTANVTAPHYGQPDKFDFDFILESPSVP